MTPRRQQQAQGRDAGQEPRDRATAPGDLARPVGAEPAIGRQREENNHGQDELQAAITLRPEKPADAGEGEEAEQLRRHLAAAQEQHPLDQPAVDRRRGGCESMLVSEREPISVLRLGEDGQRHRDRLPFGSRSRHRAWA